MDWKKIKSILIIILLITNLILGYNYLGTKGTKTEVSLDNLYQLYKAKEISFEEPVQGLGGPLFGVESSAAIVSPEMQQRVLDYFLDYDDEFYLKTLHRSISYVRYDIFERLEQAEQELLDEEGLLDEDVNEDDEESISRDFFSLSSYFVLEEATLNSEEKQVMLDKTVAFFEQTGILFQPKFLDVYDVYGFQVVRAYQAVDPVTSSGMFDIESVKNVRFPDIESEIYLYFEQGEIVGVSIVKLMNLYEGYTRAYGIISIEEAMYKALPLVPRHASIQHVGIVYKLNDSSLLASNLVVGEMLPYYEFRLAEGSPIYVRAMK